MTDYQERIAIARARLDLTSGDQVELRELRAAAGALEARVAELEAAAESARGYLAWLGRHGDENADARADRLYAALAAEKGDGHE